MISIVPHLWLIPALPIAAAGIIALLKQRSRVLAAALAIGSMAASLLLSLCAFAHTLSNPAIATVNFRWLQFGDQWLSLGWMLDPLTAVMLVMVTFVGLLIFIYSIGYMADDENFTRFFCFLALFAGAMLGVLISNSLLLLFMFWEIVGLTSYLLIGFWYANPRAAAAAKKAFLTTRIGDLGFLIGMVWLYAQSGTLLFYNNGAGCLESSSLTHLAAHTTVLGLTLSSAIGILIFCGAAGKSGQFPLHVWLPDAMEGPTPVSALIHAATMVAAGVFLIARCYPLFAAGAPLMAAGTPSLHTTALITPTAALQVVTWIGAITALFGALIAVAQWDIKRILAYSTISQLGYMMIGLGVGGPSVGIFHLITHAFFKALLFLGAGSVIHGCSGEQDIRRMGGLSKHMPITFAAYTAGMLALCGFPLFAGFWSKDAILHAAHTWSISQAPFYMGALGALLTAFYMTRQMVYVFAGSTRIVSSTHHTALAAEFEDPAHHPALQPHESPAVMTIPLVILATFAVLLGFLGTPAWPRFQSFLEGTPTHFNFAGFHEPGILPVMLSSSFLVFAGLALGWYFYGRKPIPTADSPDALASRSPDIFTLLANAFHIDALYAATLLRLNALASRMAAWLDRWIWNGAVQLISTVVIALAWIDNFLDVGVLNTSFDSGCESVSSSGERLALLQTGRIQTYLRAIGLALIALVVFLLWGTKA
jgi:NADH-quinone oxidoreductase subunit L